MRNFRGLATLLSPLHPKVLAMLTASVLSFTACNAPSETGSGTSTTTSTSTKAATATLTATNTTTSTAIATAPSISTQPAAQIVNVGQAATFSVIATGTGPLSYQWRKNGVAISGASVASYVTPAAQLADNGAIFTVLVSNSAGSATSNGAALSVNSTGKNYYVSTAGSDSNAGTEAAPFRTIAYAYSKVVAGDSIFVAPGTYTEYAASGGGISLAKNGTASAPITLKSTVQYGAIIDAGASPLLSRYYGAMVTGNYHVIDGFKFVNSGYTGLRVDGSFNTIQRNELASNGWYKGELSSCTINYNPNGIFSGNSANGNVYTQNYIHDNGHQPLACAGDSRPHGHGLYLTGDNETVMNNLILRNAHSGIQIAGYAGVDNLKIHNNTISNNGSRAIVFWPATEDGGTSINNTQVYNNILTGNGSAGIDGCGPIGTGNLISNNLFFGNSNGDIDWNSCGSYDPSKFQVTVSNSITRDPLFVNASDFHLRTGSPALGGGLSLPQVSVDFSGTPRTAPWTIGAYQ